MFWHALREGSMGDLITYVQCWHVIRDSIRNGIISDRNGSWRLVLKKMFMGKSMKMF